MFDCPTVTEPGPYGPPNPSTTLQMRRASAIPPEIRNLPGKAENEGKCNQELENACPVSRQNRICRDEGIPPAVPSAQKGRLSRGCSQDFARQKLVETHLEFEITVYRPQHAEDESDYLAKLDSLLPDRPVFKASESLVHTDNERFEGTVDPRGYIRFQVLQIAVHD